MLLQTRSRANIQPTPAGPPPQINWAHPLARDLRFAWIATHPTIELVTRAHQSAGTGTSRAHGSHGACRIAAANETVQFADRADGSWDILGDISCVAGASYDNTINDSRIITKMGPDSFSASPFLFGYYSLADPNFVRVTLGRSGASNGGRHWAAGTALGSSSVNQYLVLGASGGSSIENAPTLYVNGRNYTGSPLNLYSASGTGAPTANANAVAIHGSYALTLDCPQRIYFTYVWARQLAQMEHREIASFPYRILKHFS